MNLTRITITPDNEAHWLELRAPDLTSTDVAALFGLSPYKTKFELWHEKHSATPIRIEDNPRMRWGRRLESSVAEGIAEEMGWAVRPMKEYMRLEGERIGSSFDFRVIDPSDAILEIKCVDFLAFRDGWTVEEGFVEAPPHIELQVQHQMLVSGLRRAFVGVLIGGNRVEVLERQADDRVHAGIISECRKFWRSIAANDAPPPVMPEDADAVIGMNQFAEPGKLFDARDRNDIIGLIEDYDRLKAEARDIDEIAKVRKAEILQAIGDAEKVIVDGYSVSAGIVAPNAGTLVTPDMVGQYIGGRSGFRSFRVIKKKAKPK